ncbi:MAG: hypothetical protein PVH11_03250 [Anaerolineae bacterium]|jgi:hypothetical protein
MEEPRRDEKEEKDEKGRDESWDEKWRRDPIEAAVWALVLIWAGLVWLLSNIGFWESLFGEGIEWWAIGFLGAGGIVLLGVVFRVMVPSLRRPWTGSLIFGLILVGLGLAQLISWVIVGPLVLIGIGLAGLLAFFFRR